MAAEFFPRFLIGSSENRNKRNIEKFRAFLLFGFNGFGCVFEKKKTGTKAEQAGTGF